MTTITAPEEQRVLDEVPKQLYIAGQWRDGSKGTVRVEDPSIGETLCEVADASTDDAKAALDAAVEAGPEWAKHPPRERAEILRRPFEAIVAREEELALLMEAYLEGAPAPEPNDDARALAKAWLENRPPLEDLRTRRGLRRDQVVDAHGALIE